MTEVVWYMPHAFVLGVKTGLGKLQTLHAEAFPFVLVTVDRPGSASDQ